MPTFAGFAAAAAPWQNFYLLVGTAGATLVGLMFVAITFGASLVKSEASASARSFLDPTFAHFVQSLVTACLVLIPTMSPTLLGVLLIVAAVARSIVLRRVLRDMRAAHAAHQDLELSDWLSGIVLPALCYVAMALTGAAFLAHLAIAFDALAAVTLVLLLVGVFGAWELMVWLALTRAGAEK